MNKKGTLYAALILMSLPLLSFIGRTSIDSYTGFAYEEGSNNLIYTEHFTDRYVDGKLVETTTEYYSPDNKLIAKRTLNFLKSRFAPDFMMEDMRSGYVEGAETDMDCVTMFVQKDRSAIRQKRKIALTGAVIDGGFNQFIKSHWDKLQSGQEVTFNFTISSELDYFKLRAIKIKEDDHTLTLKIELHSRLIRWLASPIIVCYNSTTRRIIRYEGKSNIAGDDGKNFSMRLVYPDKGP
jgi:hypothetical protein